MSFSIYVIKWFTISEHNYLLMLEVERKTVCPSITQVILINLIPLIQVKDPGGCLVLSNL